MEEQLTFEFEKRKPIKGFPELHWTGKRPYNSTQYYPAQLRETYGKEQNGWINKIYWGDNLQVMSHLLKEFRGQVDLIYIDPPFDSKADYKRKIEIRGIGKAESDSSSFEEKQYGDIWTNDEYLQFMYERLVLMKELLSDNGSIYLHCDYHRCHYLRMLLDEVFGSQYFKNEILWCYSIGGKGDNFFGRKHDNILWYSKTNNYYFDGKSPLVVTKRKANSHMKTKVDENGREYQEKKDKKTGKVYVYYVDEGKIPEDYWTDIEQLNREDSERIGYPTQKPEKLLQRIIASSAPIKGIVFDCFMGSGTTQAVAMKLGRRFIGADINLGAIQTTTKRLLSVAKQIEKEEEENLYKTKQTKLELAAENTKATGDFVTKEDAETETKYTGFEVYNVNNYDFFRNPVEARDLLISALEIQPFPQSDVWDGELDGRMVKIMPVNRIATKADLEELLSNLPYKTYEKRKEENPNKPVELITIVCMGHEPDLKGALEKKLFNYKVDIEIVDILRDKTDLQLKREAEAEVVKEGRKLVVRSFYPMNLMQKLSLQKEYVEDWRQLVDSIMIDWNYDGAVMQPAVTDVPGKNEMVSGIYDIPKDAGTIKVKITDLLSESLEVEVR